MPYKNLNDNEVGRNHITIDQIHIKFHGSGQTRTHPLYFGDDLSWPTSLIVPSGSFLTPLSVSFV